MSVRLALLVLLVLCIATAVGLHVGREDGKVSPTARAPEEPAPEVDLEQPRSASEETQPVLVGTNTPAAATSHLEGRVLDDATGRPISGAVVVALRPKGREGQILGRTDAEGRFTLRGLAVGPWMLTTWHPLYVSGGVDELLAAPEGASIPAVLRFDVPHEGGALAERVLRLRAGRRIEGRVVDGDGETVPGVEIRPSDVRWRHALTRRLQARFNLRDVRVPIRSDLDGCFVLACMPRHLGEVSLAALSPGYACRWCDPISTDPDHATTRITLILLETATVTGRVHLRDGSPAIGAEVGLLDAWDLEEDWAFADTEDVHTDGDGSYRLAGVPPSAAELHAGWSAPRMFGATMRVFDLQPGETRAGVDITIPQRHVLRARLRTHNGEPLGDERVTARNPVPADEEPAWGLVDECECTDDEGRVQFVLPVSGPFEIVHEKPGSEEVLKRDIHLPSDELDLVSSGSPWCEFDVRVLDPEGVPVPVFSAEGYSLPADLSRFTRLDRHMAEGLNGMASLRVRGQPPIRVYVSNAVDESGRTLDLARGTARIERLPLAGDVVIRLERAGVLCGSFVDVEGRPVRGARMSVETDVGGVEKRLPIPMGDAGTFAFEMPPTDGYSQRVEVKVPPGYLGIRAFDYDGDEPRYRFVLRPAGTVAGRTIVPKAIDIGGLGLIWLRWERKDSDPRAMAMTETVTVDSLGQFEATHVPLDREVAVLVSDTVARAAGLQVPRPIEGVRAGARDLVFRLAPGLAIHGKVVFNGPPPKDCSVLVIPHDVEELCAYAELEEGGTFELTGLAPGSYRIRVQHSGHTGGCAFLAYRNAQAGESVTMNIGSLGDIRVHVPDADWLHVTAWRAGSTVQSALLFSYGSEPVVRLSGLPADEAYDLVMTDPEGRVGKHANARVGEELSIELVEGVPLGGRLTMDSFDDRNNLYALGEGCCLDLDLDDSGWFFARVAPGRYDVVLVEVDGTRHIVARGVEAGREDLELTLP